MKNIFEWKLSQYGHTQSVAMQTLYDEDLVKHQIDDWVTKLVGLCSEVPAADRPKFAETIIQTIRQRFNS